MRNAVWVCLFFAACTLDSRPSTGVLTNGSSDCELTDACQSGAPGGGGTAAKGQAGKSGQSGQTGSAGKVATGSAGRIATSGTGGATVVPDAGPDATVPVQMDPGEACSMDDQCLTGHCDGVCCAAGDCCLTKADCQNTTTGGITLTCNDLTTCSGSGGVIECTADFRCVAKGDANDSACAATSIANNCGPYPSVYCNGKVDQQEPACATSCKTDSDCDPEAHCDNKACVRDTANGGFCVKNLDCTSNHCSNGVCCTTGDCCLVAATCPAAYTSDPTCDAPATCQGTRKDAVCIAAQCSSREAQDDSACLTSMVVRACGSYKDITCKGTANQPMPPACETSCNGNTACDANAVCRNQICEVKRADGEACTTSGDCINSCGTNNLCCVDTGGQCCRANQAATDCTDPQYKGATCTDAASCTGTVLAPVCNNGRCGGNATASAAGCANMTATCMAGYLPLTSTCPGAPCKTSCTGNAGCAPGYMCTMNKCVLMTMTGGMGGGKQGP